MSKLVANDPTIAKLDDFHEWLNQWIEKEYLAERESDDVEKKRYHSRRAAMLEVFQIHFERTFRNDL